MNKLIIIFIFFISNMTFGQVIENPDDKLDTLFNFYVKELSTNYIEYNLDNELEWEKGYIVTNDSDTIIGEIKKVRISGELMKIRFKPENSDQQTNYKAYDLQSFQKGSFNYVRREIEGFNRFVRILDTGKIDLISLDFYGTKKIPFPAPTASGLIFIPYGLKGKAIIFIKKGKGELRLNPKKFYKNSKKIFYDYPELLVKIKDEIYKYQDIRIITKIYNKKFE